MNNLLEDIKTVASLELKNAIISINEVTNLTHIQNMKKNHERIVNIFFEQLQ